MTAPTPRVHGRSAHVERRTTATSTAPLSPPHGTRAVSRNPEPPWLRFGVRPYLLAVDLAAFGAAAALTGPTSAAHLLILVTNLVIFSLAGLYRSRLTLSVLEDLPYIVSALCVGVALKLAVLGLGPEQIDLRWQAEHAVVLVVAVTLFRAIAYEGVRQARARGIARHRTLIVGAGQIGTQLASMLVECPKYGLDPVGFVDSRPSHIDPELLPAPVLGGYERLGKLIREHCVRDVIVAFGGVRESDLVDVLRSCDRLDVEVFLVPRLFELHAHAGRWTRSTGSR